jgi:DNA-binding LacI/PurR family transcriptional regulator
MNFLRSRAEQLAESLRASMARGDWREPLPNIRAWSETLGVGMHTLEKALQLLQQQGVVRIRPRQGVQLLRATEPPPDSQRARVVRWICYSRDFPDVSVLTEFFGAILQRLHAHEIGFSIEPCDAARLRLIHARGESPQQMYLLTSLPAEFQKLFADFQRSALVVGLPGPGIDLPYVSIDVFAAVRHAVHTLSRRGFRHATLVIKKGTRQPIIELFRRACAEGPQPMSADVVTMPIELSEQVAAAGRFAARVKGRRGVIAVYSIPASVLMTALMSRGIKVPAEIEVIAVNTPSLAVRVFPTPIYYPSPLAALAKAVCRAALHYFKRGKLPPLHKTIPLERVAPASL